MALRATPTIAICIAAGIATGIALARPDDATTTADSRYESSGTSADDTGYGVGPTSGGATDDGGRTDDGGTTDDATGGDESGPATITIEGFAFSGPTAVAPGTAIDVTNVDGATHTLTSDDGLFDTGRLGQDGTAAITAPDAAGTYPFFCEIHPGMRGELVVG